LRTMLGGWGCLAPVSQRRHLDGNDVQPVEQSS
jgi:hypothetical protein